MSLPSPVTLNRVIATQRRVHSQHSKVRPAKVPFMDPHEDDLYYKEANAQRSPRPVTSNRPVSCLSLLVCKILICLLDS